jgi:Fe2+ transport system protein B
MEMQQMIERMLASQEQMMANRETDQERMERQIGSLVSIMEAARKTDRDEMKQEISAHQEHIKGMMETQFASLATKLDSWRKDMQANQEASKTIDLKANPEEMESKSEHQEIPKEHATVKPVGGLRKQHRGRKLAAG